MPDWSSLDVVATLRETMGKRSVKLTDLARLTGVPYRSLQNYFSRKTEMPVSVYLKICSQLGLDPFYVKESRFTIEYYPLRAALLQVIGQQLPTHEFDETGSMTLVPYNGAPRSEGDLWRDAGTVAHFIASAYDRDLELKLHEPITEDGEVGEGSSNGTSMKLAREKGAPKS